MNNCPEIDRLLQFVNGELDQHEFDDLDGHIESCEACQEHLANLTDVSLEQQLIESRQESDSYGATLTQPVLRVETARRLLTLERSFAAAL